MKRSYAFESRSIASRRLVQSRRFTSSRLDHADNSLPLRCSVISSDAAQFSFVTFTLLFRPVNAEALHIEIPHAELNSVLIPVWQCEIDAL